MSTVTQEKDYGHVPVLLHECLDALAIKPDGIYVDGTLGRAGHSLEIVKRLTTGRLIGIDRDNVALEAAAERLKPYEDRVTLVHANFCDMDEALEKLGIDKVDGILLDLGVSSPQLDDGQRGFSYMTDAPLDMRMDVSQGITAADLLNSASEQELCRIIRDYGEEKWAARIAQMICEHRAKKPMETTFDLVHAVDAAIPKAVRRKDDGHPARRTFQAIRIAVNDELDPLDKAICDFVDCLKPGGRMLVITFHSLEDRLVKRCFQRLQNPCTCPPKAPICTCGKKPVVKILAHGAVAPTEEEVARNPRARSAKLRVAQKLEVL